MLIRPATAADRAGVDALLDTAFGPARHLRTAARLRDGNAPLFGPSLLTVGDDGALIASVEYWPIALVAGQGTTPLTLLGPLAVTPAYHDRGYGRRLLAASLAIADARGLDPILLVGDAPYYGPFGFDAGATAGWTLPGPVERDRLLLRQRMLRPLPAVGRVVPAAEVALQPALTTAHG